MKNQVQSNLTIKNLMAFLVFSIVSVGLSSNLFAQELIEIQVSPNILNLQSSGVVVTIHTDIPFSQVDAQTVILAGVEIESWKADNNGFFVAKFDMNEVKDIDELVIGEYNTLSLEGLKFSGVTFIGSQDVLVINKVAPGNKK